MKYEYLKKSLSNKNQKIVPSGCIQPAFTLKLRATKASSVFNQDTAKQFRLVWTCVVP